MNSRGTKILVVEDNPLNMKLIRTILTLDGIQVLEAESAEQGIEICLADTPDLVLMGIALPGMDGLEATRIIKKNERINHVPVIALTAHAMDGDEEKSYEAGCDGYMTKPIDTGTFMTSALSYLGPEKNYQ
jgi:CheY-like chemotaxis protein